MPGTYHHHPSTADMFIRACVSRLDYTCHGTRNDVLYDAFVNWCRVNNLEPVAHRALSRHMYDLGFKQTNTGPFREWPSTYLHDETVPLTPDRIRELREAFNLSEEMTANLPHVRYCLYCGHRLKSKRPNKNR